MGYNCRIEYISGRENSCADALPRVAPNDAMTQGHDSSDEPDINDNTYEVAALNSNRFNPREYSQCTLPPADRMEKPTFDGDVDMVTEQAKDPLLMEVKEGLQK